jgi:P27 family predicted phage terminase small subunit
VPSPPKPTALRLIAQGGKLRGRYKERAKREPVARLGLPPPAAHLTPAQLALRQRIEASAPPGLFTELDGDLVDTYVITLAARNECARQFNEEGGQPVIPGGKGGNSPERISNPLLRDLRKLNLELLQMQAQLGYSPVSRTRIAVQTNGSDNEGKDPAARFFGPGKA